MCVLNSARRRRCSKAIRWYRWAQLLRRMVDYAVHGSLIGALVVSHVACARRVGTRSAIGADPAHLIACMAIEALAVFQGARAVLALSRDFVVRDGMPRAAVARSTLMAGHWWMHAFGALVGCAMEFQWAAHASAADIPTGVHWLVAAVLR